jgi:hypothetical protein
MTTSYNFRLNATRELGEPVVTVWYDGWDGTPIGMFAATGEFTSENEIVPDFDDLTDTSEQADSLQADLWRLAEPLLAGAGL